MKIFLSEKEQRSDQLPHDFVEIWCLDVVWSGPITDYHLTTHPNRNSVIIELWEMASQQKSRWADDEEDAALEAKRRLEKEEKKRAKAEKLRRLEAAENARKQQILRDATLSDEANTAENNINGDAERPPKRRRLSPDPDPDAKEPSSAKLLRFPAPEWGPCRHVDNFEKLNHIEEGSYGWVSRAKEIATGEVVALKKLKMDNANDGFPVTGLREIQTLMASRHTNIVGLREVVMGDNLDELVSPPMN